MGLSDLIAVGRYSGVLRDLILHMKSRHNREAVAVMAGLLLPHLKDHKRFVLTPVPSAPPRIRFRGFDHTKLIAGALSSQLGLPFQPLMYRTGNRRQVGQNREKRLEQAKNQYALGTASIPEKILLIDDVVTTGATLAACSKLLKSSGAREVIAVTVAQD